MALDVRPVCDSEHECFVEMIQNVDTVIDVERSIRRNGTLSNAHSILLLRGCRLILDSPIPRPEPIEQLRCDQSKEYAADGVCFPIASSTNSAFSIEEIFGRSIKGVCPVSQKNEGGQVHLQVFPSMNIDPPPTSFAEGRAHFTLNGTLPLIL